MTEENAMPILTMKRTCMNITDTRHNICMASCQQVVVIQRKHNLVSSKEGCVEDIKGMWTFCLPGSYFLKHFWYIWKSRLFCFVF